MESKAVGFDLAELALDADAVKILALTYMSPRGVRELCEVLKIPQVKCYRCIKDREQIGLLKGLESNKRNRTYSSNMERMSLVINESRMV
jgi:DNA-binding IclR family transcriptional regulator